MSAPAVQLPLFLACLLGVALFEGTEIALLAADRVQLHAAAKARRAGADLSLDLLQRRDRVLVTLLVASTILGAMAAALVTRFVEHHTTNAAAATGISTIIVTIVILIFGQILPKSIARQHAESILMAVSKPLFALDLLLLPITAGAGLFVRLILRIVRRGRKAALLTREEIRILVRDVRVETGPHRQEKRMLQSILDFAHTTAREVMVPMPLVVAIERTDSLDILRALVRRRGVTRVPVYDRRVDRIVGVVQIFDALLAPDGVETVEATMRPITMVPETKRIDRLMVEMQRRGESMVVVVNEFGSCTGIVTMEDIVEEIVGEMADEHEVGVKRIRSLDEGVYMVDALTDIDDLNDELGLDLPKLRYDTVGGLVMRRLGRIPREGDRFELSGMVFEVVEVYPYGVRTVKLTVGPKRVEMP
jgi:CBS domain containing-hemolysin-like protein